MADLERYSEDPGNSFNLNLSQEDVKEPLSPILSSGKYIRKIIQNKNIRHKKTASRVDQKLENKILFKSLPTKDLVVNIHNEESTTGLNDNENLQENSLDDIQTLDESNPCCSSVSGKDNTLINLQKIECDIKTTEESIFDRIHRLEELDRERKSIYLNLSVSKSIPLGATIESSVTESSKIYSGLSKIVDEDISKKNIVEIIEGRSLIQNLGLTTDQTKFNKKIGFQTGAGTSVVISDSNLQKCSSLFDDIFNKSDCQSSRSKKFNYLSKNMTLDSVISTNIPRNIENCPEFISKRPALKETSKFVDYDIHRTNECSNIKNININPSPEISIKNIFKEKYFDDLSLQSNKYEIVKNDEDAKITGVGYRVDISKITKPEETPFVNISEELNVQDLKFANNLNEFQNPLEISNGNFSNTSEKKLIDNSTLKDTTKTVTKLSAKIFDGIDFEDLKFGNLQGFQKTSAISSGKFLKADTIKPIKDFVLEDTDKLKIVTGSGEKLCRNIFEEINFEDLKFDKNLKGFQKTSEIPNINFLNIDKINKSLKSSMLFKTEKVLKTPKNIFEGENFDDLNINFNTMPGVKNKSVPSSSTNKIMHRNTLKSIKPKAARNIFEGENFDDLNLYALKPVFVGFNSKSNIPENSAGAFKSSFKSPVKNIKDDILHQSNTDECYGFTSEEKQLSLEISQSSSDISSVLQSNFFKISSTKCRSALIELRDIDEISKNLQQNCQKLHDYLIFSVNKKCSLIKKRKFSELDSDHNSVSETSAYKKVFPKEIHEQNINTSGLSNTPLQDSFLKRPKKRLGVPFSPTISVSERGLKRARVMFQDDIGPKPANTSTPVKSFIGSFPSSGCNITPVISNISPFCIEQKISRKSLQGHYADMSKSCNRTIGFDKTLVNNNNNNGRYSLNKPSEGDVNAWIENLNYERRLLDERLRMVNEKQTILVNQKTILDFSRSGSKRIKAGVLFVSKQRSDRQKIGNFVRDAYPGDDPTTDNFLHQINPQNAHLVHFYLNDKGHPFVTTEDGATIVPNIEGRIGVSEIEHSFRVMEGVDFKLIPKGWIRNHYKWIIWKLASYERSFLNKFQGSLCVENVVQQLKYRYDIEIDKVKRSALRKILEKDDCPQRRMILCVSKIVKVNNTYELELTDGWYPIRTLIDQLLTNQIVKQKLRLGVKIMTYGAELFNCDGCHPLEASQNMYLKINYNSTRLAIWWAKLGYQKYSLPFLIPMSSINLDGGKIGRIKVYVARVYPIKYLEKIDGTSIWRNKKAEQRKMQQFQNENIKLLENIDQNKFSQNKLCSRNGGKDLVKNIRNIEDPELLYDIFHQSGDPESIQENLSSYQKSILTEYQINKSAQEHSKLLNKIQERKNTTQDRDVTPLLKMKFLDASQCESEKIYEFNIWRPQEWHLQLLREGDFLSVYNVSCSSKWGLGANRLTQFKTEPKVIDEKYEKFRRKVTLIGELISFSGQKHMSNEFDTIGLVVKKRVDTDQELWLTDVNKNLLLIKINESPKTLLLLDIVEEGQVIAVSNLIFKQWTKMYSCAMADHFTVFSRYPQHKLLQNKLEIFNKAVEKQNIELLEDCRNNIYKNEMKNESKVGWENDEDMECSQITSTDLALLECVDKLT